jgi:hypothetical protein
MSVDTNWWAIIICMVSSVVLGFIWYGPLFGKKWMALSNIQMPADKPGFSVMIRPIILSLVGAFFMSYVLSLGVPAQVGAGLLAGLAGWLGFVAPVYLNFAGWENKPWALFFINGGYWLVLMLIMGAVIAAMR